MSMYDVIETGFISDPKIEGLEYRVTVMVDSESSPNDYGLYPDSCYTQKQYDAWKRDEWSYVGVGLTPIIAGNELSDFQASLWAVEYGDILLTDDQDNETGHIHIGFEEIKDGTVPDLMDEVRGNLATGLTPMITVSAGVLEAIRKDQQ